jgi:hypothetical protein
MLAELGESGRVAQENVKVQYLIEDIMYILIQTTPHCVKLACGSIKSTYCINIETYNKRLWILQIFVRRFCLSAYLLI